ncbi:Single-stranded DNA-binding protein [Cellulomonas sp. T2.31MG-18]|uniref:single-stranded DNA-binding protein n=1 Tax=Cellulomonas sp. T2.31MG-18 TaxID=3157619 RepID=UPI0035EDB9D8
MSTQSTLTITGWLGSDVKYSPGGDGAVPYAWFRLGATRRFYDRASGEWRDAATQWFTVKVWRHVAANVAQSLRKGDPVLVHGRFATDEWTGPDGPRTTLVIEADALGPDLTFGSSHFARTVSPGRDQTPEGAPADLSGLAELDDEAQPDAAPAEPDGAAGALGRASSVELEPADGADERDEDLSMAALTLAGSR